MQNIDINIIPSNFKGMIEQYIETLTYIKDYNLEYVNKELLKSVSIFLKYISSVHHDWIDLKYLSRHDIESFIHFFNNNYGHLEQKDRVYFNMIKNFIYQLDIILPDVAPIIGASSLIFESDIPRPYTKERKSNVIPTSVRKQFDLNIKYIDDKVIRDIIFIARRTGISIIDICNIKSNNCLESINYEYFLVLDIKSNNTLNYKLPLSEDCTKIIKERMQYVSSLSEYNELLFFKENKQGKMKIDTKDVIKAANKLVREKNINYNGAIFKFTSNSFRETKVIELIDAGLNEFHIKELLGYRDISMIEKYKSAYDNKLLIEWEQSNKILEERINRITGKLLTKTFIEEGECSSVDVKKCYKTLNPCIDCSCFYITPKFIQNYKYEINRLKSFLNRYKHIDNAIIYLQEHYTLLKKMELILNELESNNA